MVSKWSLRFIILLSTVLLIAGCGAATAPPTAVSTTIPETAAPTVPATATQEAAAYEILGVGQDTTWDDRAMAYLESELVNLDPFAPEFEAQVRWGYGYLYERYPDVAVLELDLLWEDDLTLILDTPVAAWKELASGRTSWETFWPTMEKQALDLETGELYMDEEVDAYLADLGSPVAEAQPTATRRQPPPTAAPEATSRPALPTATPKATSRPALPTATPEVPLGRTYEDPAGFFALDYPRNWVTHQSRSEMQFWADSSGDVALAVSIQIKAVSAEALVDQFSALFAERWDGYQEISRQDTMLSGYPTVWVEQSYRLDGVDQRGLLVGVVRNRVGILLLAWAPEADYAEMEASFQASIASLRVTEFTEAPPYDEWQTYASAQLVFHYLPGTWVAQEIVSIAADHEETFDDIVQYLDEAIPSKPIDFYIYTNEASFYRSTAREAGFAINEHDEVHSRWFAPDNHQSLGHEMTHVITYWMLGNPSEALLGEGIAVCLDHSGNDYQSQVRNLYQQGEVIPLAQMLGDSWGNYAYAYPVSGTFVCFLLDRYGVEAFKEIYPQTDFMAALEDVYGADLDTIEQEWLETLQ
jgi:hypothetical protein